MNTQPRLTKVVVIGTDAERKDYTGVAEHLKDKGILIIENPCDSFIPTACVRIDPFSSSSNRWRRNSLNQPKWLMEINTIGIVNSIRKRSVGSSRSRMAPAVLICLSIERNYHGN